MKLNPETLPKHIAIIMDGNGRWAKKRFLPRIAGHNKGVETIKEIVRHSNKLGIKVVTIYAFSTENWGRPEDEVKHLMNLPKKFFDDYLPELMENNIKVQTIGDIKRLPKETHNMMKEAFKKTENNDGMILNIALNYGSQHEITQATRLIAQAAKDGDIAVEDIDIDLVSSYLETANLGEYQNPDLMIRTSGEQRLSNFLLWQLAYSEFYFVDKFWPDFTPEDLEIALQSYADRNRRYGKL
ncbi:isoprenyl transferase [Aerococcaceae bacterium DSM 111176]|nr:isoprenyl transferase [Aerococcaceae bacterium DSM 111176]